MSEQNLANHAKYVPAFHFFVLPVFAVNFVWSFFRWKASGFSIGGLIGVLVAAALIVIAFLARIFALKVQDRVIRIEERQRCERLLPGDLQPRIHELTTDQLVALRFASDAEFPGLARKVLEEKVTSRKSIKGLVKSWKADHQRA